MTLRQSITSLWFFVVLAFTLTSYAASENYRSPESVDGATTASIEQAKALFDAGTVFVDVRNPRLYAKKHVPGAAHLDLKNGFNEVALSALVDRDQPVVIYCSGVKCSRSYRAVEKAVAWGFEKVHYFRGGIVAWREAGYPLDRNTK